MSEAVQDFIDAMRAAGVDPAEPIAGKLLGGKLVRFRCQGDGKKRNGWAIFFPGDGERARAGGAFGNHKQNTGTISWSAKREGPVLSDAERARLRATIAEENARRERELADAQLQAQRQAMRIWNAAGSALAHPYAGAKRMRLAGLRQEGDALLVPMRDAGCVLWNLQRIYPDGTKRFLKGGRIIGLCAVIGWRPAFTRGVFAEGYATADAIAQALRGDRPVVVAFNTANLAPVVAEWTARYPRADWIIAADDDHLTGLRMAERGQPYQNPGVEKAREVAAAHGCRVAYPPVLCLPRGNVDFSDVFLAHGGEPVREAFAAARRQPAQASLAERIGRSAA